jgi:hypothetical protein
VSGTKFIATLAASDSPHHSLLVRPIEPFLQMEKLSPEKGWLEATFRES